MRKHGMHFPHGLLHSDITQRSLLPALPPIRKTINLERYTIYEL